MKFPRLIKYRGTKFGYDAGGLRISKSRGKTETKYLWGGDKLIGEHRTTSHCDLDDDGYFYQGKEYYVYANHLNIEYIFGATGVVGFELTKDNAELQKFWYLKNIQGDVVQIYDDEKNIVAEYKYDPWGNTEILVDIDGIGTLNPIRYRGYYWDDSVKMYYLKSRWYDAEVGRFVNMDEIEILDETMDLINGLNLHAYCGNNPLMNIDPSGRSWWKKLLWFICPPAAIIYDLVVDGGKDIKKISESITNIGQNVTDTFYGFWNTVESGVGRITGSKRLISISITRPKKLWRFWEYSIGIRVNINGYGFGIYTGGTFGINFHSPKTEIDFGINLLGRAFLQIANKTEYDVYMFNRYSLNIPEIGLSILGIILFGWKIIPAFLPKFI